MTARCNHARYMRSFWVVILWSELDVGPVPTYYAAVHLSYSYLFS